MSSGGELKHFKNSPPDLSGIPNVLEKQSILSDPLRTKRLTIAAHSNHELVVANVKGRNCTCACATNVLGYFLVTMSLARESIAHVRIQNARLDCDRLLREVYVVRPSLQVFDPAVLLPHRLKDIAEFECADCAVI
jgi:hypothetical protein